MGDWDEYAARREKKVAEGAGIGAKREISNLKDAFPLLPLQSFFFARSPPASDVGF